MKFPPPPLMLKKWPRGTIPVAVIGLVCLIHLIGQQLHFSWMATRTDPYVRANQHLDSFPNHAGKIIYSVGGGDAITGSLDMNGRYAYTFVVGGCGPEKPSYRFYLYDIMVAAHVLREDHSRADVVVMIQMSSETNATELPDEDVRMLQAMDIKIKYIPKATKDSFYSVAMQKFRIAGLTEYKKVLFMDADMMPMGNLDYLFELSEQGVLQENFVIPEHCAPSNAGLFVLTPYPEALADIDTIIKAKEDYYNNPKNPDWDLKRGWGHVLDGTPDYWEKVDWLRWFNHLGARKQSQEWDFTGASADQGLLFYYTKYFRKSVSIVWGNTVENWGPSGPNGEVIKEEVLVNPFAKTMVKYRGLSTSKCKFLSPNGCYPPISDIEHFWVQEKPWLEGRPRNVNARTKRKSTLHLWFYTLGLINDALKLNLEDEIKSWGKDQVVSKAPPLGYSEQVWKPSANNTSMRLSFA